MFLLFLNLQFILFPFTFTYISKKLTQFLFPIIKEYQIPEHPSYDSIINKNLPHEKPLSIPLYNSDGAGEELIADQDGIQLYLSDYIEREKEKEKERERLKREEESKKEETKKPVK